MYVCVLTYLPNRDNLTNKGRQSHKGTFFRTTTTLLVALFVWMCMSSYTRDALTCFQLKAEAPSTKAPEVAAVVVGLGGDHNEENIIFFPFGPLWSAILTFPTSKAGLAGTAPELSTSDGRREAKARRPAPPRSSHPVQNIQTRTKRDGEGTAREKERKKKKKLTCPSGLPLLIKEAWACWRSYFPVSQLRGNPPLILWQPYSVLRGFLVKISAGILRPCASREAIWQNLSGLITCRRFPGEGKSRWNCNPEKYIGGGRETFQNYNTPGWKFLAACKMKTFLKLVVNPVRQFLFTFFFYERVEISCFPSRKSNSFSGNFPVSTP